MTSFAATMETGGENAAREMQYFDNIEESRQTLAYHNATSASSEEPHPNKVATLNAAKGRTKGPAKSMLVQKGDSVHIEVKASYEEHSRKPVKGAGGIIAAIAGMFNPAATGLEAAGTTEAVSEVLAGASLVDRDRTGVPKAYLNYLVMNEQQEVIDQGFVPVTEAAKIETGRKNKNKDGIGNDSIAHETLVVDLDIQESGYLYTYVSNESNWDVDVHFDDVVILAEGDQPTVIQSDDFYPFGLQMAGRSFESEDYRYGFQGQEKNEELNTIHFKFREHDPKIGRFWSVDPLASSYPGNSPYAFAQNRLIDGTELEGLEWQPVNSGGENVAVNSNECKTYWGNIMLHFCIVLLVLSLRKTPCSCPSHHFS